MSDQLAVPPREDVAALAGRLAELLSTLSAESVYHLQTALGAASLDGVGGDLLIRIPRRTKEHAVVKWVGGSLTQI